MIYLQPACAPKKLIKEKPGTVQPEPRPEYLWVIKTTVNIRANSSVNSQQIGILNDGDSVVVLSNQDGWYRILTEDKQTGWIRSDLLGPNELSVYARAVKFSDSLKVRQNVDLFFDKKLHHRRIYLSFPESEYGDPQRVISDAENLASTYQQEVYPGDISVIILQPASDDVFHEINVNGIKNADVLLPVVPFGRIVTADLDREYAKLTYQVKQEIARDKYITTAREMAGTYPISYREIVLVFTDEKNNCRFWFREDSSGELYRFDSCP